MDFDKYSELALDTDTLPITGPDKLQFLALGLNEEAGEIARLVKKLIRNDIAEDSMRKDMKRKIGDVLWYLNAFSASLNLNLSDIAEANLKFTERRWLPSTQDLFAPQREPLSDENERFPDTLMLEFHRLNEGGLVKLQLRKINGDQVGDVVDDNEYLSDDYRFHDVIHLALVAYFRWSPVFRKLLHLKRKNNSDVDRVEDGAKARDVEEAICKKIFTYLRDNNMLDGITAIDTSFLTSLRNECQGREIANVTEREWELAIMNAAHVIRQITEAEEGYIIVDCISRNLVFKRF